MPKKRNNSVRNTRSRKTENSVDPFEKFSQKEKNSRHFTSENSPSSNGVSSSRKTRKPSNSDDFNDDDFEEPGGKKIYQDIYILGRKDPFRLPGSDFSEKRRQRKNAKESDSMDRFSTKTRLLSTSEFLDLYAEKTQNSSVSDESTQGLKNKADKKDSISSSSDSKQSDSKQSDSKQSDSKQPGSKQFDSKQFSPKKDGVKTAVSGKKRKNSVLDEEQKFDKKRGKNVGSEPGERGESVGLRVIGGRYRGTRLEYSGDHRVRPMKDRVREAVFNLIGRLCEGKHAVDLFAGTGALAFESVSRGAVSATLIEVHFPTARIIRNNIERLEEREKNVRNKFQLLTTDVFHWARFLAKSAQTNSDQANSDQAKIKSAENKFAKNKPTKKETEKIESANTGPTKSGLVKSLQQPENRRIRSFSASLPTSIPWIVFVSPPYDFYIDREQDMLELIGRLYQLAPSNSVFVVEADERFDFSCLNVEIPDRKRRSYPPAEVALFFKD